MREASDRDIEAHTGSCKMDGETNALLDLSQSCQCYILQKRPVTKLLGLRNWLNELVFFPGHTRLPPVHVSLIQVWIRCLLLHCFKQLKMVLCQARLFDCFLFSLIACIPAALSLSSLTDSKYSSSDVIS
jgi:hypothetical protein